MIRDAPQIDLHRHLEGHIRLATINTDDPGISPVTLRDEFGLAAAKAGLRRRRIHVRRRKMR